MSTREAGINVLTLLEIGTDELQWLQGDLAVRDRYARQAGMVFPGWFGSQKIGPNGASRYGWTITEFGTSGELRLQAIFGTGQPVSLGTKAGNQLVPPRLGGIMPSGQPVQIKIGDNFPLEDVNGDAIVVPDDATWHTLVATYATEVFEPGVLQLVQNNGTVTGIWTDFTRYSDSSAPVPTVIRIDVADSANGNEGEYTVTTVTDADTMSITPAPPGADETVRFRVKGRFFSAPAGEVDAHLNGRIVWELRSRVTTPPADALVAYDVFRDTGGLGPNVVLVDRRVANTFRPLPARGAATATRAVPALGMAGAPGSPSAIIDEALVVGNRGSAGVTDLDLAPCLLQRITGSGTDANGMLLAWVEADGVHAMRAQTAITTAVYSSGPGGWSFEAQALKIARASITGFSLEQMQSGKGGWTHMAAYSAGGKIRIARSADNGANFSELGVVWDPSVVNGAHVAHSPALLWTTWGRMILAAVYEGGGTKTIRYITSDDYGDTWAINGNSGTTALSGTVAPRDIELVQDGFGNIIGFYVEDDAADDLWTWQGTSPNNPTIDNDKAGTADRGTKLFTGNVGGPGVQLGAVVGQPRAIAYQDGTVAVAFEGIAGGTSGRVALLHLKENELQRIDQVLAPDVATYAGPAVPCVAFDAANTGDAFLVYVDTDATANGDLYARRFESHQLDTSCGWPGGR